MAARAHSKILEGVKKKEVKEMLKDERRGVERIKCL